MPHDLEQALRTSIEKSGLSLNELAKRSGVDKASLSRFASGERSLTLGTATKIMAVLGITVAGPKRRKGGR